MNVPTNKPEAQRLNHFAQEIGFDVANWHPCEIPAKTAMEGRYCDVVPLDAVSHAQSLYEAVCEDAAGQYWTYLFSGPFRDFAEFQSWLFEKAGLQDPLFFTVLDKQSGQAIGMASFMRMDPAHGVIEVGNIYFSPMLQKTPMATEAMYLMMRRVFDELGYRRYEWKCDSCNAPSKKAAVRFGFTYEGLFRQAIMYKGRNRDTSWFSIIDKEWPAQKLAFETWLGEENFDEKGIQRRSLAECAE